MTGAVPDPVLDPVPGPVLDPVPDPPTGPVRTAPQRAGWPLAVAAGALVAVGLGVYGRVHEPAAFAISVAGFSSGTAVKAWLTTGALLLALVQLGSALALHGRLPRPVAPARAGAVHRWSGRAAVLLTVPVAVHCLYALGLRADEPRVLLHSLLGCFVYGLLVTKMLLLRRTGPAWALPVAGGALFTALVGLWLTAALWFFTTTGLTL